MYITDRQAQTLLQALYYTAEKDCNDIIANAASALAARFERASGKGFVLSDLDYRLVKYAVKMKPVEQVFETNRRKTYKRRVTVA